MLRVLLIASLLACQCPTALAQQQIAGRYQISVADKTAVLIDTATGESWVYEAGSPGWRPLDFALPGGDRQRLPPPERAYLDQ